MLPDHPLLLDGATGTELETRGLPLVAPLWTTRAILEAPDLLRDLHRDYLDAGAELITTNTFRAHARNLHEAELDLPAREIVNRAVAIAAEARDQVRPGALVLGSVAPLEDCYRPDLAPDETTCGHEHERMIRHLLDAGVDHLLIETMGTLREAAAAARAAERLAPNRWSISLLMAHDGPPGMLFSGEPAVALRPHLVTATAVGVNCIPAPDVRMHLQWWRKQLPGDTRLVASGNTGQRQADGTWRPTRAEDPEWYASLTGHWREAGATIIGGCCGTTPETIRAVAGRWRAVS